MARKCRSLLGDGHALVGVLEDVHARLAFQLEERRRDGGLRHKKPARRTRRPSVHMQAVGAS